MTIPEEFFRSQVVSWGDLSVCRLSKAMFVVAGAFKIVAMAVSIFGNSSVTLLTWSAKIRRVFDGSGTKGISRKGN
jgi:hypothetical protein